MRPAQIADFLEHSHGIVDQLISQLTQWSEKEQEREERQVRIDGGAMTGCICGRVSIYTFCFSISALTQEQLQCVATGFEFEDQCCNDPNCVTNDPYFINIVTNPQSLQLQMAAKNDLW
jgi:hypothetical protein